MKKSVMATTFAALAIAACSGRSASPESTEFSALCDVDVRNVEADVSQFASAWGVSRVNAIKILVYLRTLLHNWLVKEGGGRALFGEGRKSPVTAALEQVADWMDAMPEVFFELHRDVKAGNAVPVSLPTRSGTSALIAAWAKVGGAAPKAKGAGCDGEKKVSIACSSTTTRARAYVNLLEKQSELKHGRGAGAGRSRRSKKAFGRTPTVSWPAPAGHDRGNCSGSKSGPGRVPQ